MSDLIDRQKVIDAINQSKFTYKVSPEFVDNRTDEEKRSSLFQLIKCTMVQVVEAMPSAEPDLVEWLIDTVLDEDSWELNKDAFPEIACRKLEKMGYLTVQDGYYTKAN